MSDSHILPAGPTEAIEALRLYGGPEIETFLVMFEAYFVEKFLDDETKMEALKRIARHAELEMAAAGIV